MVRFSPLRTLRPAFRNRLFTVSDTLEREALLTGPFVRLWLFTFITFFSAFQLFPTIPFRILDLGGSRAEAGLFLAFYTWASALSAPFSGALADRVGHRRTLLVSAGAFVVFSLLYGIVTELWLLVIVACFHGVFWSALLSASGALVTEVIPESRRAEGIGYWGMAPTGAIAVAPAAGLAVYRMGWRVLTWDLAALSVVIAALALTVPRGTGEAGREGEGGPIVSWRVVVCASTILVLAFGYGGVTSYAALMAVDRGIEPPSLIFTVFAVTMLVGRITVVPWADRVGPTRLLLPSLVIVPPSFLVLGAAEGPWTFGLAGVLFGLGFGSAYPAFMTWVLARTDRRRRAATFGSVLFAMDAGIGVGSLVAGLLIDEAGYGPAFATAAAVAAFSLPLFLASRSLLEA